MKKVSGVLAVSFVAGALMTKPAIANEGLVDLRGQGTSGACFASSIFMDGVYKIMATCRELKTALTPEKNRYVLWIEDEVGKQRRLGEIVNGKFMGQVDQKFLRLLVTSERDAYANKPSEDIVLAGGVRQIDFGPGVAPATAIVTPTPTMAKQAAKVVEQNNDVTTKSQNGLGSAVATLFKIVILGFGALLVVVGVTSFLSRRRSL